MTLKFMKIKLNETILSLFKGDITTLTVDGIVNAANSALRGGGGVDGAIHRAGGPEIMKECRQVKGGCPTGSAVTTTAGNLSAKRVIHAVGPVWRGGRQQEAKLLGSAYSAALQRAEDEELRRIAFPSISTGVYGYPIVEACEIAVAAVLSHLRWETNLKEVIFVLFSQSDYEVYQRCFEKLLSSEPDLELVE